MQTGFGRAGSHFWGFETQGVVPDIVVMGKPIGNGHPMGAVVTTREIAASFDNGMEFFSTFGGNPVSCAIGLAVLDVIEHEGLQARAAASGRRLMDGLRDLMLRHAIIGDVRGMGLFIGVELVRDRGTMDPAAEEAADLINRVKDQGILLSTNGPLHNVLKIKPPMVLTEQDVDMVVRVLDDELQSHWGPVVMRVFLVHHADAVSPAEDAQRPLSAVGRDQAARMAQEAKARGCQPVAALAQRQAARARNG